MMKPCTRCKAVKDLAEFPRDKRAKDGRASRCNACMSEILAAYKATPEGSQARKATQQRYQNSPSGSAKRAEYARSDKSRSQRKHYAQTDKGKEVMRKSREDYRQRMRKTEHGRLQLQAKNAVRHATERGELPPIASLPCACCQSQAEHYHHAHGYAPKFWLHVEPLCRPCHNKLHNGT